MEKEKKYIVYLLFLVSIIMLAVPVFPHHHHADGLICMKNDVEPSCCHTPHHHHPAGHPNCCHDKGCIASHFVQRTPRTERQAPVLKPVLLPVVLSTFLRQLYAFGEPCQPVSYSPYIESLHGVYIARASGLRAPPSLLA